MRLHHRRESFEAGVANSNATLEAQQAALDQAKQTYDRNKSYTKTKIISKSELRAIAEIAPIAPALANYNAQKENIKGLKPRLRTSQTGTGESQQGPPAELYYVA